jgi:GDP-4-dehydro-6-deoxy-D-mannose reductase
MKAIVVGSEGFVGKHLTRHLEEQGWFVKAYDKAFGHDLLDYEQLRTALDVERPDAIFHLAAQAYVPESFQNPRRTFEVNTIGSLNLLEAVRQLGIKTRVHLAGTSEEYGDAQYGTGKITEEALPNPLSPYAISKLAMDHLGRLYAKSYGMDVVVTRAFNHAGPGRGEMYAESAFAKQIVEVELGRRGVVQHGNLESIRNYTDVRDIVRAYVMAIDLPSGVYNICSDQNVSMQEIMDMLKTLSTKEVKTEVNPSLYRPADFSFKTPECKKFHKLTGWKPEIPLNQTMEDVLNHWRDKLI